MGRRLRCLKSGWLAAAAAGLLGLAGCDEIGPSKPASDGPEKDLPESGNFGHFAPANGSAGGAAKHPDSPNPRNDFPSDPTAAGLPRGGQRPALNEPVATYAYQRGYKEGTDEWQRSRYGYLRSMNEREMESHLDQLTEINKSMTGVPPFPVPEMPPKWSPDRQDWIKGFRAGLNAAAPR